MSISIRPASTALTRRLKIVEIRQLGIVAAFIALFVALSIGSDAFLSSRNLTNVVDQCAPLGIVAVGGTLVLIAGGFDLSVAGIVSLTAIVAVKLANITDPTVGFCAAIVLGALIGLANGLVVTMGRINPLIATLATGFITAGLATIVAGSGLVTAAAPSFANLGSDSLLGVTYASWIFLAVALVCGGLLSFTIYGKRIFAAGGNDEAARLEGS
jgi:ribose transport system permease protein